MKLLTVTLGLAALIISAVALAQSPASGPSDALTLLQQVSQRYADAKSYHIKSIEEGTESQEFEHNWNELILIATEGPGNRYRFEGQGSLGSAVYVSDGKTEWLYDVRAHLYTQKPVSPDGPDLHPPKIPGPVIEAFQAKHLRDSFASLANHYKSATQLPDEVVTLDGRQIPCLVVRMTTSDLKHPGSSNSSSEETIWIDKSRMTVVKHVDRTHAYMGGSEEAGIPVYFERVTTYPVTELDLQDPDPALFSFTAPQDAKLVDKFPEHMRPDLTGKTAPSLSLKAADGKQVSLESFRGKPVLVDFWATWCAPCVEGMPKLAHIYEQTKDKGLVLLTIDQDEEAKDATDFLAKKRYAWSNFHDEGAAAKAFGGSSGIPRTILIDPSGKIVYDNIGNRDDELLAAIARLGPSYFLLSPKPKQEPCLASK